MSAQTTTTVAVISSTKHQETIEFEKKESSRITQVSQSTLKQQTSSSSTEFLVSDFKIHNEILRLIKGEFELSEISKLLKNVTNLFEFRLIVKELVKQQVNKSINCNLKNLVEVILSTLKTGELQSIETSKKDSLFIEILDTVIQFSDQTSVLANYVLARGLFPDYRLFFKLDLEVIAKKEGFTQYNFEDETSRIFIAKTLAESGDLDVEQFSKFEIKDLNARFAIAFLLATKKQYILSKNNSWDQHSIIKNIIGRENLNDFFIYFLTNNKEVGWDNLRPFDTLAVDYLIILQKLTDRKMIKEALSFVDYLYRPDIQPLIRHEQCKNFYDLLSNPFDTVIEAFILKLEFQVLIENYSLVYNKAQSRKKEGYMVYILKLAFIGYPELFLTHFNNITKKLDNSELSEFIKLFLEAKLIEKIQDEKVKKEISINIINLSLTISLLNHYNLKPVLGKLFQLFLDNFQSVGNKKEALLELFCDVPSNILFANLERIKNIFDESEILLLLQVNFKDEGVEIVDQNYLIHLIESLIPFSLNASKVNDFCIYLLYALTKVKEEKIRVELAIKLARVIKANLFFLYFPFNIFEKITKNPKTLQYLADVAFSDNLKSKIFVSDNADRLFVLPINFSIKTRRKLFRYLKKSFFNLNVLQNPFLPDYLNPSVKSEVVHSKCFDPKNERHWEESFKIQRPKTERLLVTSGGPIGTYHRLLLSIPKNESAQVIANLMKCATVYAAACAFFGITEHSQLEHFETIKQIFELRQPSLRLPLILQLIELQVNSYTEPQTQKALDILDAQLEVESGKKDGVQFFKLMLLPFVKKRNSISRRILTVNKRGQNLRSKSIVKKIIPSDFLEELSLITEKLKTKAIRDDSQKQIKIISAFSTLIDSKHLTKREKWKLLVTCFSCDSANEAINALSIMKSLIQLKETKRLSRMFSVSSMVEHMNNIFVEKVGMSQIENFSELFEQTFAQFRHLTPIFAYFGNIEEDHVKEYFSKCLTSILHGHQAFQNFRYKDNQHTLRIFKDQSFKNKWIKGSKKTVFFATEQTKRKMNHEAVRKYLLEKIIEDEHLVRNENSLSDFEYQIIKEGLESPQDINSILGRFNSTTENRPVPFLLVELILDLINPKNSPGVKQIKIDLTLKTVGEDFSKFSGFNQILNDLRDLSEKIAKSEADSWTTMTKNQIVDTDDPQTLLYSGFEVVGSCLSLTKDYCNSKGLTGILGNPHTRIVAMLRFDNTILCRRFFKALWDEKLGKTVLLQECIYSNADVSVEQEEELDKFFIERAVELNATLVTHIRDSKKQLPRYPNPLTIYESNAPYEYHDVRSELTIANQVFQIKNCVILYEPPTTTTTTTTKHEAHEVKRERKVRD